MIVVLAPNMRRTDIDDLVSRLAALDGVERVDVSVGHTHTVLGLVGDESKLDPGHIQAMSSRIVKVVQIQEPYRLVARALHGRSSVVEIGGVPIGDGVLKIIAGPCACESEKQMMEAALAVQAAGAHILRGEIYKPRTSPYAFQGLGEEGLIIMAKVSEAVGMPFTIEVLEESQIPLVSDYAHGLRIGARNMQNFALLEAVGRQSLPVILKRGLSATLEELLMAAEYIARFGNSKIILMARGIRTFETATRNTADLDAIPWLHGKTHLPVGFDPSHAAGLRDLVPELATGAVAMGADVVMMDVHPRPEEALVDGDQAITPNVFAELTPRLWAASAIRKLT